MAFQNRNSFPDRPIGETRHQARSNCPAYEKWRRDDLYHLAQQCGIERRAEMSNAELASALSQISPLRPR